MFHTLIMKAGSFLGMQRERETHTRTGSCGKNMINFLSILAYTERERELCRFLYQANGFYKQREGEREKPSSSLSEPQPKAQEYGFLSIQAYTHTHTVRERERETFKQSK